MESAKSRFLRYVTYYTTSDEFTGTSPSTERQKVLGRALMQELEVLKLEDVHMDDCGNVLATLPASALRRKRLSSPTAPRASTKFTATARPRPRSMTATTT